jgi:hypothetical protein
VLQLERLGSTIDCFCANRGGCSRDSKAIYATITKFVNCVFFADEFED